MSKHCGRTIANKRGRVIALDLLGVISHASSESGLRNERRRYGYAARVPADGECYFRVSTGWIRVLEGVGAAALTLRRIESGARRVKFKLRKIICVVRDRRSGKGIAKRSLLRELLQRLAQIALIDIRLCRPLSKTLGSIVKRIKKVASVKSGTARRAIICISATSVDIAMDSSRSAINCKRLVKEPTMIVPKSAPSPGPVRLKRAWVRSGGRSGRTKVHFRRLLGRATVQMDNICAEVFANEFGGSGYRDNIICDGTHTAQVRSGVQLCPA
jgi:hypothetical protein